MTSIETDYGKMSIETFKKIEEICKRAGQRKYKDEFATWEYSDGDIEVERLIHYGTSLTFDSDGTPSQCQNCDEGIPLTNVDGLDCGCTNEDCEEYAEMREWG